MEANQKPAGGGGGGDPLKEAGLRALLQRTGYQLRQEKGQRRYGAPPPGWEGPPPERGSEIFVGKLPRDLFEDELVPLCEKFGRIYEVRMMMDFNGNNRGYAFVTFGNKMEAKNAVKQLNNHEIRPGRLVGVVSSVDNCRLFVGGVPRWKRREEVLAEIQKVTDGAVDAIVYPAANDKTKNRGFAFVEFQSHRHAAMARRKLLPGRIQLWGHSVAVDWAEPEVEVDEETMATVKILYVRNLMLATSEETLMQEFSALKPGSVERVKKIRDYAFVHFSQRDDAIAAMNAMNGKALDGSRIEVTLAKPVDKESYVRYTRGTGGRGAGPLEYPAYSLGQVFEASSAYLGAPVFYAAPPPYVATPLSASFQRYPLAKVGGRGAFCAPSVREVYMSLPVGAAGLRGLGGRGYLAYPPAGGGAAARVGGASSRGGKAELSGKDDKLYELLPGMELTPLAVSVKGMKAATQVLEELCLKNSWGVPLYSLHSAVGPNQQQLFLYKVTVPALAAQNPSSHPFTPGKLSASLDEAKNHAAEHTLTVLGLQAEPNASAAAYAGFGTPSKTQDLNLAYEAFPPFTVAPPPDAYPGF